MPPGTNLDIVSGKNSDSTDSMTALLDELRQMTDATGRSDLSNRLALARNRVSDPRLRIVVAGESKKGMSTLVDALVESDALAAKRDPSVPVTFQYGPTESNTLVPATRSGESVHAEVTLPRDLLAEGIVVIDAPGATGEDSGKAATTLSLLPSADAVLFVSDASQEYTAPELSFLQRIHQICPTVICVINKIDLYPRWADIQKANRRHLTEAGLGPAILPVSSLMKQTANEVNDPQLDVESGVPQLIDFIRQHVIARADAVVRDSVINDVRVVSDHVALSLNTELHALDDPRRNAELVERMRTARDAADRLRQRSANWQYTLGDGSTELTLAIEHDLRHRLRTVVREAEEDIMKSDPAPRWAEFSAWLDGRVSESVCENFVIAHTRSLELADTVAAKFAEEGQVSLPDLHIDNVESVLDPVRSLEALESGKTGIVQRVVTSMRGSYGGVLMVGLATSLMGLALVNPFSIGAGVLLGANTFLEDRKGRTARRQAEAKVAVSRLMDDVVFQVGRESKQRLREVQRTLRDHFTEIANEMLRSVNDSLQAAQEANNLHESRRAARINEIRNDLGHLRELRIDAARFATSGAVTP